MIMDKKRPVKKKKLKVKIIGTTGLPTLDDDLFFYIPHSDKKAFIRHVKSIKGKPPMTTYLRNELVLLNTKKDSLVTKTAETELLRNELLEPSLYLSEEKNPKKITMRIWSDTLHGTGQIATSLGHKYPDFIRAFVRYLTRKGTQ